MPNRTPDLYRAAYEIDAGKASTGETADAGQHLLVSSTRSSAQPHVKVAVNWQTALGSAGGAARERVMQG